MASFEPAVQNTILWEGGYSHNPLDPGGETYEGISRKTWPNWEGWQIIDTAKPEPQFPTILYSNPELAAEVVNFYHTNFWHYDGINDQAIANKIFDLGVNVGQTHAIKIVQMAASVNPVDGIWGPNTLSHINSSSNGSLLQAIRSGAEEYHKEIVQTNPQDAEFLAGWIRRDQS